jgi:hypothetical protein
MISQPEEPVLKRAAKIGNRSAENETGVMEWQGDFLPGEKLPVEIG